MHVCGSWPQNKTSGNAAFTRMLQVTDSAGVSASAVRPRLSLSHSLLGL